MSGGHGHGGGGHGGGGHAAPKKPAKAAHGGGGDHGGDKKKAHAHAHDDGGKMFHITWKTAVIVLVAVFAWAGFYKTFFDNHAPTSGLTQLGTHLAPVPQASRTASAATAAAHKDTEQECSPFPARAATCELDPLQYPAGTAWMRQAPGTLPGAALWWTPAEPAAFTRIEYLVQGDDTPHAYDPASPPSGVVAYRFLASHQLQLRYGAIAPINP